MLLWYFCLMVDEVVCIEKVVCRIFELREVGGLEIRLKDMGGIVDIVVVGDFVVIEFWYLLKG